MTGLTAITPTDKQAKGISLISKWFKDKDSNKPIFILTGYAGTGKSTIVRFVVQELELQEKNVCYAAYTGMATSVLLRKGNANSSTIHKLIYDCIPIEDKTTGKTHFEFKLKDKLDDENIRLIIIDEFSMVGEEMISDLLSFNVPILALGDNGQLEPITGTNTLISHPDFFLDEILRQALDNPIIYLSMLAREKKRIQYGTYGENAIVIKNDQLTARMFKEADQVLAGRNFTVDSLNKYYRKFILEINDPMPIIGDRVMCLKNDWNYNIYNNGVDIYLVNGLIGTIEDKLEIGTKMQTYNFNFKPIFVENNDCKFRGLYMDKLLFIPAEMRKNYDTKMLFLMRKELVESKGLQEFKFGYCVTVHKYQGSECPNVLLFDEILRRDNHHKWLYTGITRAKEKLILVI